MLASFCILSRGVTENSEHRRETPWRPGRPPNDALAAEDVFSTPCIVNENDDVKTRPCHT